MLVEKNNKFNANDIVIVKLITGEELIATLVSADTSTDVSMKRIMTFAIGVNPQTGEQGVTIQPASFGIDAETVITIERSLIIWISQPNQDAKNAYINLTSSIKMASTNDVGSLTGMR